MMVNSFLTVELSATEMWKHNIACYLGFFFSFRKVLLLFWSAQYVIETA